MSKTRIDLENAKSCLICAEREDDIAVEFQGDFGDRLRLTTLAITAFCEACERDGMDKKASVEALFSLARKHINTKSVRVETDSDGAEEKKKSASEDDIDEALKKLENLINRIAKNLE